MSEKTNNELLQELSSDKKAKVYVLVSQGKKLKDAIAQVSKKAAPAGGGATEKPKLSAKERKAAIAKEIEALGGEAPASGASVAKFEEALTAAKAAKERAEADAAEKEAAEKQAEADEAKAKAEKEKAEADKAEDLM